MEIKDVIQSIGVITTIIFSLIALVQSLLSKKKSKMAEERAEKANQLSNEANNLANTALNESRKDYMPLIKFVDGVEITEKDINILRNEITFDFYDAFFNTDIDKNTFICISTKIKNIGKGIVTGIKIQDFFIQSGNKVLIDSRSDEPIESLCFIKKCECEQQFILDGSEETIINFIITDNIMEREPINNSEYEQKHLWGTYIDNKIIHNSFSEAKPREKNVINREYLIKK
ncbi:hypothetical protein NE172_15045 [Clostridium botulinum]|uniref:Uncharacterized protein n=1 Tax=Clostridium botulinum TaxID=1491 RepID=A0A6B4JJZ3_CLOBO|nr:hypothetical protein [Clostridium botulinum]EES49388.1 hypothetical protein CLO_0941 [Clostridium botulinum E1 str. 'BoNT E Beluga']MBY6760113.1 hypothetical protein [Clostridium botulinum]MBY6919022.1 hypothetical protein [Clostridium botulinum]MCR1132255.1 hypothetical protein [Clostridium botulinum]NFJ57334.1 hypothetical protein [Clostridium botulinum]